MYRQLSRNPKIFLKPGHITASSGMVNSANSSYTQSCRAETRLPPIAREHLDRYLTEDELNHAGHFHAGSGKRCKRIEVIPFLSIEDWETGAS